MATQAQGDLPTYSQEPHVTLGRRATSVLLALVGIPVSGFVGLFIWAFMREATNRPALAKAAAIAIVGYLGYVLIRRVRDAIPDRLVLSVDHLIIEGGPVSIRIPFDQVAILQAGIAPRPERPHSTTRWPLEIRTRAASRCLYFDEAVGKACLDALRRRCPDAVYLDHAGTEYPPLTGWRPDAVRAVSDRYRGLAFRSFSVGGVVLALALLMIALKLYSMTHGTEFPRLRGLPVLFIWYAVQRLRGAFSNRARARAIDSRYLVKFRGSSLAFESHAQAHAEI